MDLCTGQHGGTDATARLTDESHLRAATFYRPLKASRAAGGPAVWSDRLGITADTKRSSVLAQIFESAINESADLPLYLLDTLLVLGECHPAEVDRVTNTLVNLTRSHPLPHLFSVTTAA